MNTRSLRPSNPLQAGVTATVKWFNTSKGFGFVAPQDGSSDAFLHISVLQRAGLSALDQGAEIVCDLEQGPKGPQVCQVISVDTTNAVPPGSQPPMDHDMPYESEGVEETIEGVVKFFSPEKGFGFVAPDSGGKDVFVGIGSLNRSGLQALESGQRVRLNTRMGKKGPMAEGVELL
ncbi:MAG: cold-shock protein [Flavobacteriia bacterium]|nr:cold-shock protein [Flavobacteriia bacterium]